MKAARRPAEPRRRAAAGSATPRRRGGSGGRAPRRRARRWRCPGDRARARAPRRRGAATTRARLAVGGAASCAGGDRRHLDLEVDAVEQRPADPRPGSAAPRRACSGTPRRGVAELAARARVHRRDELEARPGTRPGAPRARRRCGRSRAARAAPRARRAGTRAARRGRGRRGGRATLSPGRGGEPPPTSAAADAVWCGARSTRSPQRAALKRAGDAQDRRRLERLVVRQRRQQAGEALRQHRLAGAGRADHQQRSAARPRRPRARAWRRSGRARRAGRAAPAARRRGSGRGSCSPLASAPSPGRRARTTSSR